MDWTQILPVVGSFLSGSEASDAGDRAAAANIEAAKIAADAAAFKPYAVTTGFGTSYFDPSKSQAGYEMDPILKAFRDKYYGSAATFLDQLQTDPQAAAQQYYAQQQQLMAPEREAEDIALRQQQLQQGRIGLGISGQALGAGAAGMVNPQQYQRDLALLVQTHNWHNKAVSWHKQTLTVLSNVALGCSKPGLVLKNKHYVLSPLVQTLAASKLCRVTKQHKHCWLAVKRLLRLTWLVVSARHRCFSKRLRVLAACLVTNKDKTWQQELKVCLGFKAHKNRTKTI